jgi:HAD superfamily hydrolase (TIGR01509 family)
MPNPTIDAVLFDADGVLQRATVDWRAALATFIGPSGPIEDFVLDLMKSEGPSLIGKGDFREALVEVLGRWGGTTPADQVLDLWRQFEAEPEVVTLIQQLRTAGIESHLATNQQAFRRSIMHDERHYGDWFDQTFYSCDLGVAKPDPEYFRTILDAIDRPASSVLFIDDNEANIAGAKSIGLHAELYDLKTGVGVLRELLRRYGLPIPA